MMNNNQGKTYTKVIATLLGLPWIDILADVWKFGRQVLRGMTNEGMYEVLDYESTLELKDKEGEKATLRKRERVRYLQDNIIAYQDQAWGDGKILQDYRSSPGTPVDQYRAGHKTYVLISLRELREKGNVDEFNIEWTLLDGFLKKNGFWGTAINHKTKKIRVHISLPKDRPPIKTSISETNLQRTHALGEESRRKMPDGRWMISWEKKNPKLYENYVLNWEW